MKTFKQVILIGSILLSSIYSYAGKEAGDGEGIVVDINGNYEAASRHFVGDEYSEYHLSSKMKNFILRLLTQTDKFLSASIEIGLSKEERSKLKDKLQETINLLSNNKAFLDSIYGDLKEFRIVENLPDSCRSYEEGEIPPDRTFFKFACSKHSFVYLLREHLPKLDAFNLALILIHEGFHSHDSTFPHEAIADIIKSISIVETKVNKMIADPNSSLTLTKSEIRTLEVYPKRVNQFFKEKLSHKIIVHPNASFFVDGANIVIKDDPSLKKSFIGTGTKLVGGTWVLENSQIRNSFLKTKRVFENISNSEIENSKISLEYREAQEIDSNYGIPHFYIDERTSMGEAIRALLLEPGKISNSLITNSSFLKSNIIEFSKLESCFSAGMSAYKSHCIDSNAIYMGLSESKITRFKDAFAMYATRGSTYNTNEESETLNSNSIFAVENVQIENMNLEKIKGLVSQNTELRNSKIQTVHGRQDSQDFKYVTIFDSKIMDNSNLYFRYTQAINRIELHSSILIFNLITSEDQKLATFRNSSIRTYGLHTRGTVNISNLTIDDHAGNNEYGLSLDIGKSNNEVTIDGYGNAYCPKNSYLDNDFDLSSQRSLTKSILCK